MRNILDAFCFLLSWSIFIWQDSIFGGNWIFFFQIKKWDINFCSLEFWLNWIKIQNSVIKTNISNKFTKLKFFPKEFQHKKYKTIKKMRLIDLTFSIPIHNHYILVYVVPPAAVAVSCSYHKFIAKNDFQLNCSKLFCISIFIILKIALLIPRVECRNLYIKSCNMNTLEYHKKS